MTVATNTPAPDPAGSEGLGRAVTPHFRLLMLCLLLGFVSLGLWGLVTRLPETVYSTDWILGENGNQLFRADQLQAGKSLYRDVDCQYGPLPIWIWYGFSRIAGNTIPANVLFQNLLTLVLVGGLFWWATQNVTQRSVMVTAAIAVGILTFAATPYLRLLASPSANFEYLTFERLCLLVLMAAWRPPDSRSLKHAGGLVTLFLLWQLTKVGGALIGLTAFFAMDVIWLMALRRRDLIRSWVHWWTAVGIGVAVTEAIRCGLFLLCFGWEQGWRSAWPLYVADEYQRTWLTVWANPRHFITVIFPILALIIPFLWLIGQSFLDRSKPSCLLDASPLLFQGAVGTLFYLVGAIPKIGYFGHEWHFFQYQWVLLPLALICLRLRPCLGLAILLVCHAGPLNRTIKELRHATPSSQLDRLDTAVGPLIAPAGDGRLKLIKTALEKVQHPLKTHSLIVGTWGGGGWYVIAGETERPHNIFFSNSIIRRLRDNEEFAALLETANVVLIKNPSPPGGQNLHEWFAAVAGPASAELLKFRPSENVPSPNDTGWILLTREQVNP